MPTELFENRDSLTALSDKRILIVDDEPLVTRTVSAYLRKGGYTEVRSENDSREVISAIREFKPDLVLLDINMPHISGLELLEQIGREHDFDSVVVLMLSAAGEEEENKSYDLGSLGFVPKPATAESVLRIVTSTFRIANRFGAR